MSSLKPLGRRHPTTGSSSTKDSSSSSLLQREQTRTRLRRLFTGIRFHVVPAKLSAEFIESLLETIEKNGGKTTSDPEQSDIIVTAIGMKARLLRHIRWELVVCAGGPLGHLSSTDNSGQSEKPLVTPDWIIQSVKRQKRLLLDEFLAIEGVTPISKIRIPADLHDTPSPQLVQIKESDTTDHPDRSISIAPRLPPNPHFVAASMPKYCIQRFSPLVCANQELVMQFAVIRRARGLDGNRRSALSYSRAIAVRKFSLHMQ